VPSAVGEAKGFWRRALGWLRAEGRGRWASLIQGTRRRLEGAKASSPCAAKPLAAASASAKRARNVVGDTGLETETIRSILWTVALAHDRPASGFSTWRSWEYQRPGLALWSIGSVCSTFGQFLLHIRSFSRAFPPLPLHSYIPVPRFPSQSVSSPKKIALDSLEQSSSHGHSFLGICKYRI
jgi:hypothetical protein